MSLDYFVVIVTVVLCPCLVRSFLVHDGDFEYFTYAQSWPPGTCVGGQREHHICHVDKSVKTWTVHGLWPSVWSGNEPFFCNKSMVFDFSQIASLGTEMNTYWPNLYNDTEPYSFWKHEWEKHGTCAMGLDATKSEYLFFKQGLALNSQYDILNMLAKSNIVPKENAKYSYSQFIDAIKKVIGQEPVLGCAFEKLPNGTDYHLIEQIEICLDKTFQPISCLHPVTHEMGHHGHTHTPQSNCPEHYSFNYPPIKPV